MGNKYFSTGYYDTAALRIYSPLLQIVQIMSSRNFVCRGGGRRLACAKSRSMTTTKTHVIYTDRICAICNSGEYNPKDVYLMNNINDMRNIILDSQHLLKKSSDCIENIVSDICGLQYDPNPTIHLNQYIMLWNRKKDFKAEQLDIAAYKNFKVVETWTFKRNMFFIPRDEYSLYKNATKGIVRWGSSDESWLAAGDSPDVQAAENKLKESLIEFDGLTAN